MSVCEFYPTTENLTKSEVTKPGSIGSFKEKTNVVLQDELIWGLSYRHYKKKEKQVPIPPKKSPIDIPFKLCRERQRNERKRGLATRKESADTKTKSKSEKQPSLLEKSVMTQSQYMDYLSAPRRVEQPASAKKRKRPCEIEPCPPRFVQLAVPNKRRVYENWKAYHEMLPTEVIVRYEQLLHTDKNLEPREARYYYKRLDKKKRKEMKQKRKEKKKKQADKEKGDQAWLRDQINKTTEAIMDYIKEEPLFTLNYKQLLLSDGILDRLERDGVMTKPSRKTKNQYKKTIVDVTDKLAVWMDTLTRFVDIQAVDSEEDICPLTLLSLLGLDEEELEEDEEEETEEEEEESRIASEVVLKGPQHPEFWEEGEEGAAWGTDLGVGVGEKPQEQIKDLFVPQEADDRELDPELLAQLIEILKNSPEEFLQSFVNKKQMPNVTYQDVLEMLLILQSGELEKQRKKRPLEGVLVEWAKKNDPDKVDDRMLDEIRRTAEMLGEWWLDKEDAIQEELTSPAEKGDEGEEEAKVEEAEAEEGKEQEEEGEAGEEEAPEEEAAVVEEVEVPEEGKEFKGGEEGEEEGEEGGAEEAEEETAEAEVEKAPLEDVPEEEEGEAEVEEGAEMGGEAETKAIEEEAEEGEGAEEEEAEAAEEVAAEGGDRETQLEAADLIAEKEEELMISELEGEGVSEVPSKIEAEGEEEEGEEEEGVPPPPPKAEAEIAVLFEPGMEEITAAEAGKVIKGHKPSVTFEHSPNMVCCLSLKTWAVWLLEITHNAHNWTKWVHGVIRQVREFAATIRGDVVSSDGKRKVLYKQEWRDFAKEVDEMIVAWRQYGAHVKELSTSIVDNFHGKEVKCCPKCLQDHLIKNVVAAHETLQALTEAMNCAGYWQRCLDEIVDKTGALADIEGEAETELVSDESSEDDEAYIEDVTIKREDEDEDDDAVYDIEEINNFNSGGSEGNKRPSQPRPPGP